MIKLKYTLATVVVILFIVSTTTWAADSESISSKKTDDIHLVNSIASDEKTNHFKRHEKYFGRISQQVITEDHKRQFLAKNDDEGDELADEFDAFEHIGQSPVQFIVKFKEHVKLTETLKQLFEQQTSVSLLQYFPHHSYLIYITPSQLKRVREHPTVAKVFALSPDMKINPPLAREMESGSFATCYKSGVSKKGGTNVHLSVRLVPQLSTSITKEIAFELRRACEKLTSVRFMRVISNRKIMITLQICSKEELSRVVDIISHHPSVHWIERFDMERDGFMPENYEARRLIQGSTNEKTGVSIGDGPFFEIGLTGKNQTVAISDSGLDTAHCFFHDPKNAVPTISGSENLDVSKVSQNHRKIRAYVTFMDNKDGGHGHGSHTSGTLAGKCLYEGSAICKHNGLAQDSKLVFFDVGCDLDGGCSCDSFDACPCYMYPDGKCPGGNKLVTPIDLYTGLLEPQYKLGARISSNSLGGAIGYGYTQATEEIDRFQYEHDDFLVVWSAGNSGAKGYMTLTGPTKQAKNSLIVGCSVNSLQSWEDVLSNYRNYTERTQVLKKKLDRKYGCKCGTCHLDKCSSFDDLTSEQACDKFMGKDCTLNYKLAAMNKKQNFNVSFACSSRCALKHLKSDKMKPMFNTQNLADFSSLGPTLDGRIKPDLVAPGYFIVSTQSHFGDSKGTCSIANKDNMKYQLKEMGGTSMSTPVVAGAAAIVRQYFADGFYPHGKPSKFAKYTNPSASLVKAILISSARGMTGLARKMDYFSHFNPKHRTIFEGFGKINLSNTLKLADRPDMTTRDLFVVDRKKISTDVTHTYTFTMSDNSTELSITLVWTDYPASPMASLSLVNDLDLKLEYDLPSGDTETIYGNHLYNNNQPDRMNNVEKIILPVPPVHTELTITVTGKNVPHGPQAYSLVVNGKKITKPNRILRSLDVNDVSPSTRVELINWEFALIVTSLGSALLVSLAFNVGMCVRACIIKRKNAGFSPIQN